MKRTSCCHQKKVHTDSGSLICLNQDCDNYLRPTTLMRTRHSWNNIFILAFGIFFFIFSFDDFSITENANIRVIRPKKPENTNEVPLNAENLRKELNTQHIICQEQVFAQIMIESGNLNSYLCTRTNNLLGMRYPYKRESAAIGLFLPNQNLIVKGKKATLRQYKHQNQYAVYASWQDCIRDYKFWQDECFRLTDRYLDFLGTYYASDSSYVEKIKQITR